MSSPWWDCLLCWVLSGWFFGLGKAITKAIWAILSVIVSCVVCACVGGTVGYLTGSDLPTGMSIGNPRSAYFLNWIAGGVIFGLVIGVVQAVRVITEKD